MFHDRLYNTAEDRDWLRETSLRGYNTIPDFGSFTIEGHEDCPLAIRFYVSDDPSMTDPYIEWRLVVDPHSNLSRYEEQLIMTLSTKEIEAGLDRLSRQFMTPSIEGPIDVISYEDPYEGTIYLPAEYVGDVPIEHQDTIERHEGKYLAKLSASGYMDQTDTTMHDTYEEAAAYLVETYDDGTPDIDDDSTVE
jgi:hypothetical protein